MKYSQLFVQYIAIVKYKQWLRPHAGSLSELYKFHVRIQKLEYGEESLKDEMVHFGCFKRPVKTTTCCLK